MYYRSPIIPEKRAEAFARRHGIRRIQGSWISTVDDEVSENPGEPGIAAERRLKLRRLWDRIIERSGGTI